MGSGQETAVVLAGCPSYEAQQQPKAYYLIIETYTLRAVYLNIYLYTQSRYINVYL